MLRPSGASRRPVTVVARRGKVVHFEYNKAGNCVVMEKQRTEN